MLTSVVSYPDRGRGGNPRFHGNCSPRLLEDLFRHYRPRLVYDPMVGSGTTRDVAERMGITGYFDDLATGFNVLRDEPPFSGFDLAFVHPPYHDTVIYTGGVWPGDPHPDDLSRCPSYEEFLRRLDEALYRTRKPDAWVVPLRVTAVQEGDLRRFSGVTWQTIVRSALEDLGGEADLANLYRTVGRHARARRAERAGTDWRAIVRRELQTRAHFARVSRGRWRLVRVH